MRGVNAARAYRARSADRNLREQEADIRAVSENRLLWNNVVMTLKDPQNALPENLRCSIIAVGLAVERELHAPNPDLPFLIGINEQITAGLTSV